MGLVEPLCAGSQDAGGTHAFAADFAALFDDDNAEASFNRAHCGNRACAAGRYDGKVALVFLGRFNAHRGGAEARQIGSSFGEGLLYAGNDGLRSHGGAGNAVDIH